MSSPSSQSQHQAELPRQKSDEAVAICDAYYAFLVNPRQDTEPPKRPTAEQRDEAWERWMENGGFRGWGDPGPLHTALDYEQNPGLRLIRDSQDRRAAELIGRHLRREHPDSMFPLREDNSWGPKITASNFVPKFEAAIPIPEPIPDTIAVARLFVALIFYHYSL
ncbi:hypothetical protein VNI00_019110 [Paramarasmius palmivorus]|uniref:Uncharacterized protein n=1 Tax=Paramarasmius palmivorus TaxID=297713 RepID=A0AAW0AR08_9AGAR